MTRFVSSQILFLALADSASARSWTPIQLACNTTATINVAGLPRLSQGPTCDGDSPIGGDIVLQREVSSCWKLAVRNRAAEPVYFGLIQPDLLRQNNWQFYPGLWCNAHGTILAGGSSKVDVRGDCDRVPDTVYILVSSLLPSHGEVDFVYSCFSSSPRKARQAIEDRKREETRKKSGFRRLFPGFSRRLIVGA